MDGEKIHGRQVVLGITRGCLPSNGELNQVLYAKEVPAI